MTILDAGRAAAESLMTLTLDWYTPAGTKSVVNGMERRDATYQDTTPGKVQASTTQGSDTATRMVAVGGVDLPIMLSGLHIPVAALTDGSGKLRLKVGWECEVTRVDGMADPALLGRRYRVEGVPVKSHATARRLDVVDITHLTLAGSTP